MPQPAERSGGRPRGAIEWKMYARFADQIDPSYKNRGRRGAHNAVPAAAAMPQRYSALILSRRTALPRRS